MRDRVHPLLLLLLIAAAIPCARAHAEESLEYKVKAGCLFKFLQFVEWPPDSFREKESPVVVGILGDDPFKGIIDKAMQDRNVEGRKIVVRRYRDSKSAREAHVLFLNLRGDALVEAVKSLEGAPTLTVGEASSFIESGGMIRFVTREEKLSFDISVDSGKSAGLKFSAQLLRLAHVVERKSE